MVAKGDSAKGSQVYLTRLFWHEGDAMVYGTLSGFSYDTGIYYGGCQFDLCIDTQAKRGFSVWQTL